MTTERRKIKVVLDESRMLVLGAQIFLGFAFRGVFEPAFERLPRSSQNIKLVSLFILLLAIGFLMAPGSYHRIVRAGNDAEDVHEFATTVMDLALMPFLIVVSLDLYVATGRILGMAGGVWQAALVGMLGAFLWYGFGLLARRGKAEPKTKTAAAHSTRLEDKIDQTLTEARVVLPGVQTLLGFQFATMFMDAFDKLPNSLKYLHIASLGLMAVTMIFLMTPAAYHRLAERGEDTQRFYRVAGNFLLAAMVGLPLGICGDVYIVFRKVTGSGSVSIAITALVLLFFYGLWFGFTAYRRMQLQQT